jgi:hypothetical protein
MAPAGDLNKIVNPLLHKIIFSIARVYAGSSGVVLRNFTMVANPNANFGFQNKRRNFS